MTENVNETAKTEIPPHRQKSPAEQKQQRFLVILIIIVAVAAGVILYRNGVMGGGSERTPAEQYLYAIAARDFDSYVEVMPPRIAQDYKDDLSESGLSETDFMRELYSDYFDEFGEDMTVALEFNKKSRVKAQYLDLFKESYRELYGEELKTSSAFELDISALFSGSKSKTLIPLECFVVKVGGKWYVVGCDYKTEDANEASEE